MQTTWRQRAYQSPKRFRLRYICYAIVGVVGWWLWYQGAVWLWNTVLSTHFMPIQRVVVTVDAGHIANDALAARVRQYITGNFLVFDVSRLEAGLLQEPWVSHIAWRRVWPNRVEVTVTEQQAVAQWGMQALLNPEGRVFKPPVHTFPARLPQLRGPKEALSKVWQAYGFFQAWMMPLKVQVTGVSLNARGEWQVELDHHLAVLVGQTDVVMRWKRFVAVYAQVLGDHAASAERVDLRYSNGLAVKFASPEMF
ncbi:MAG: hypothetical protein A3J38_05910 [Gammaproteobacteria bacterium RIFCSPHIGHO2_12_FULL_45_9]|nr:MAG: hypothetical protein A3J38_05910 [Gammaproteobacteria bacterium RIFCSPHIGHO2_12_FULL_45_9]